jgi:hypothetical protein
MVALGVGLFLMSEVPLYTQIMGGRERFVVHRVDAHPTISGSHVIRKDQSQLPRGKLTLHTTQRATKGFSVAKPPKVGYVIHRNPPMSLPYCLP